MVEARFTGPTSLRASVDALSRPLVGIAVRAGVEDAAIKVVSLLAGLCSGYAAATREWLFAQQEQVKQALLRGLYGDAGIDQMGAVKHALDPEWKLAPGVIFDR